jgi:hypothetical protein
MTIKQRKQNRADSPEEVERQLYYCAPIRLSQRGSWARECGGIMYALNYDECSERSLTPGPDNF